MPMSNSIANDTTVMMRVVLRSVHHTGEVSTSV